MDEGWIRRAVLFATCAVVLLLASVRPAWADDDPVPVPDVPVVAVELPAVDVPTVDVAPAPDPVVAVAPSTASAGAEAADSTGDIALVSSSPDGGVPVSEPSPSQAPQTAVSSPTSATAGTGATAATTPAPQYQGANTQPPPSDQIQTKNIVSGDAQPATQTTDDAVPTWRWNWDWNCVSASAGTSDVVGPALDVNGPTSWIWNWSWTCDGSSGNTAVSIRVLSPGDNGAVTQTTEPAAQASVAATGTTATAASAPPPGAEIESATGAESATAIVADVASAVQATAEAVAAQTTVVTGALFVAPLLEPPVVPVWLPPPQPWFPFDDATFGELTDDVVAAATLPTGDVARAVDEVLASVAAALGPPQAAMDAVTGLATLPLDVASSGRPRPDAAARPARPPARAPRALSPRPASPAQPAMLPPPAPKPGEDASTAAEARPAPARTHAPALDLLGQPLLAAFGPAGAPEHGPQPSSGLVLLVALLAALTLSAPGLARVVRAAADRPAARAHPRRPDKPG